MVCTPLRWRAVRCRGRRRARPRPSRCRRSPPRSVVSAASFPDARTSSGPRLEATVTAPRRPDVRGRCRGARAEGASAARPRLPTAGCSSPKRTVESAWCVSGRPTAATPRSMRARLDPPPVGASGLALHPDFAQNHFVYVSFLAQGGAPARLRLVRLREVGDTLGEPATIFEAPLAVTSRRRAARLTAWRPRRAARSTLAPAWRSVRTDCCTCCCRPASSSRTSPRRAGRTRRCCGSTDDGRVPRGPLSGIVSHPLGFAWHPATRALWGIVPERDERGHGPAPRQGVPAASLGQRAALLRMTVRAPALRRAPWPFRPRQASLASGGRARGRARPRVDSARSAWRIPSADAPGPECGDDGRVVTEW